MNANQYKSHCELVTFLQEVETIIKDTLDNYYLKQQKPSAQKTSLEMIRLYRNANIIPPHPNTMRHRIEALSDELNW